MHDEVKLLRDLSEAVNKMTVNEIRYLVDTYYTVQKQRIRTGNQLSAALKLGEPCEFIDWVHRRYIDIETTIVKVLDKWTKRTQLGKWCRSIHGIGPVITAGLMAHINLKPWVCRKFREGASKVKCTPENKCTEECGYEVINTASKVWRFAGLDPTTTWKKGVRRPWNGQLKTLCWKMGESFVKTSGNPKSFYGKIYLERKKLETEKNERLEYRQQAEERLQHVGKNTEAYKWYSKGMLPPGHIHERAKRYAVKIFLSHYHKIAYELEFGESPPFPYPITVLGHADYICPPERTI